MSENIEETAEVALEEIEETGKKNGQPESSWTEWAAMSSMIMALFAALGGLLAGMAANDALVIRQERIGELIELNQVELTVQIKRNRLAIIKLLGTQPEQSLLDEIKSSDKESEEYRKEASEEALESAATLHIHELFAMASTALAAAITLTGMAFIVKKKKVWYMGMALGTCGAVTVLYGVFKMYIA